MSVVPGRLDTVPAHQRETPPLERRWWQRLVRSFVKMPQHIHLALTTRARTGSSQFVQCHKTLAAIVPFDGQFLPDNLNVQWPHGGNLPAPRRCVHENVIWPRVARTACSLPCPVYTQDR